MECFINQSLASLFSLAQALEGTGLYDYLKISNLRLVDAISSKYGVLRIPVVDLKTKERGVAPVLFGDIYFPKLRNEVIWNVKQLSTDSVIRILDEGMTERVITDEGQAKRFKRYYKPDRIRTRTETDVDFIARYIARNNERWVSRGGKNIILPHETQKAMVTFAKEYSGSRFEEFIFEQEHGLPVHALVETQVDNDYLHWVNTYVTKEQDAEFLKKRVGNNILYHLMLRALAKGKAFNLGIDTFDYKKLWSDEVHYVRGFTY